MSFDPRQIRPDYDVYSADGEDLGDVEEVREGYLVVRKGLLFPHEHYIPFAAITRVEPDSVYLNVTKDQVEQQGWDEAPAAGAYQGRAAYGAETGAGPTEGERTVQLREEELRARKRPVEAGEVGLRKEVVSEQKTMDVPVTHEEAVVERRPVDRQPADRPIGEGETIKVPLREERVEVEKQPVVREEVEIGKRQVQDTERVSDTVRREEVRLEGEGDVDVRGDEPRRR